MTEPAYTFTLPDGSSWAAADDVTITSEPGPVGHMQLVGPRLRKGALEHLAKVRRSGPEPVDLIMRGPDAVFDVGGACYHTRTKHELVLTFARLTQR